MKSELLSAALSELEFRLYLAGYGGLLLPRWLRKVMASSSWHRSWLNGHMGLFLEDGKSFGVCDRTWYAYRKGNLAAESSMWKLLGELLHFRQWENIQTLFGAWIEWMQSKVRKTEITPHLSETQTAWLARFRENSDYRDEVVAYLASHAEVKVTRQTSDRRIPPYVIQVVATGFWLDCLPAEDEAVELAESLGLKVVYLNCCWD